MGQDKKGIYEGYGPGGVAIHLIIDTEDVNRTWATLREVFKEFGGTVGIAGEKSFLFHEKAVLTVSRDINTVEEDQMMLMALDAGADEVIFFSNRYDIIAEPRKVQWIRDILEVEGIEVGENRLEILPKKTVDVVDKQLVKQLLTLLESLKKWDENIVSIAHNGEFPEGILEKLS